ncbi:RNA recognition motif domain [Macleaya cordata]|uniref:RNA recognition motif domain n=1 Tax=Macleaya cordata TaxID=56857 RepID=A0A200QZS4_MACCD|nr:RNA recognition motif domain [Macleaya cordata]
MEMEIDHYVILGLPSGEEGAKLSDIEIGKAYRSKALELHPDKRPNDPNAHAEFQRLKSSYEILKDEKARKLFNDLLRVKRDQRKRQSLYDGKRRKMMSDLEERERASFAPDPTSKAREEEERIAKKLKEEIARIRAMHSKSTEIPKATTPSSTTSGSARKGEGLDEEKVLKVSWEGDSEDYTAQRLRELFMEFGDVEDVVIRSKGLKRKKKIGSALVVMASKDATVAALKGVCGDLSNPLLVLPLHKTSSAEFSSVSSAKKYEEPIEPKLSNLVGAGYQTKEDSILQKLLKKAAEKQK